MRMGVLIVALVCVFGCQSCSRTSAGTKALASPDPAHAQRVSQLSITANASSAQSASPDSQLPATDSAKGVARVDFQTQIKPIFEARCQPCHFSGGKVYEKMPFDRPATIKSLGTKLFTRIKDENERRLISAFLTQE
jgi:hypothetical protein